MKIGKRGQLVTVQIELDQLGHLGEAGGSLKAIVRHEQRDKVIVASELNARLDLVLAQIQPG